MAGISQRKRTASRTGIVFSSGFFGFFAHAGFLNALRELGIKPVGYAGASSGAIVAAMVATGMSDQNIKEILFQVRKTDFWDPDPLTHILKSALRFFRGYRGYLRGDGYGKLLKKIPIKHIEDCPLPLIIVATNLSQQREERFTKGPLIKAIQASGAVPGLFKPVEIDGALFVDGGMVNKAPVQALADLVQPEKIIVHFIASENIGDRTNNFLQKRVTPWHMYHLAVNVSRHEAYQRQCDSVRKQGIEVVEVRTHSSGIGPDKLAKGLQAYRKAKEGALKILSSIKF